MQWRGALAWAVGCGASCLSGCESYPQVVSHPLATAPEWSTRVGGDGLQVPRAIAPSDDGVIVAGVYAEDFSIGERRFDNRGGLDGVVASLGPAGELRWARELSSADFDDSLTALANTPDGGVYVGGQAGPGAAFGDSRLDAEGDVPSTATAIVAKLDAKGEVRWHLAARGAGSHSVTSIAVTARGDVYFSGLFSGELDWGTGVLTSEGPSDAFLARATGDGEIQWLKALTGDDVQFVSGLAVGDDGEVTAIGGYFMQLSVAGRTFPNNPLADVTPFVAHFDARGKLAWLQSELLAPEVNHVGQEHHQTHKQIGVTHTTLAVAPNGEVTAVVAYGNTFGQSSHDFEATVARNLTATRLDARGDVQMQGTLTTPDAMLFLGSVVADDAGAELAVSWTGTLPSLGQGGELASEGRRSLAVLGFAPDGSFSPRAAYSVPATSLTGEAAVRTSDGSLAVAVSWRDLQTFDRDIFLARFR